MTMNDMNIARYYRLHMHTIYTYIYNHGTMAATCCNMIVAAVHIYSPLWLRYLNPSSSHDGTWPEKMPVPLTLPASSAHGAGACHLGSGPSNFSAMAP